MSIPQSLNRVYWPVKADFYDYALGGGPSRVIDSPRSGARVAALRRTSHQHLWSNDDMEEYERLKELVESAADDVDKASGGNKAAGTRVRKTMQEIKEAAQSVRKKILEVRSEQTAQ